MPRNYQIGDAWFVVSSGWWQRVVGRGESDADTRIRNADVVDASRSCRCCSRSVLQPGLMEDVDYRLVNERVWRALALEFGYDWEIRREVKTLGRRLAVDVYPSGLEERVGHNHVAAVAAGSDSPPTSPLSSPEHADLSAIAMEQWRNDLKIGQLVDALDTDSKWYEARIVDLDEERAKVHYRGWSAKWDEWLSRTAPRLMPLHTRVRDWRRFRVNDEVQVGEARPGKKRMLWRDAKVTTTRKSLLVQLQIDDEVQWMDAQDERLCPPGTHRTVNGTGPINLEESATPSPAPASSSYSFNNITPTAVRRKRLKTSSNYSPFDD